jgi:hypothetical protein
VRTGVRRGGAAAAALAVCIVVAVPALACSNPTQQGDQANAESAMGSLAYSDHEAYVQRVLAAAQAAEAPGAAIEAQTAATARPSAVRQPAPAGALSRLGALLVSRLQAVLNVLARSLGTATRLRPIL